jgi:predicted transcriptional regulator of viral defense system
MGCFTRKDVVDLTGNADTANSLLFQYQKRKLIENVRRGLFVARSLETKQPVPNRYAIASHVAEDAYITHHSAFEYYGFANQVYYEVYVASEAKFREFEFDGIFFRPVPPRISIGAESKKDGVRVTDMERTVLDSIHDFEKIGGLEETLRCIEMVPFLDAEKLLFYLDAYDKGFLYQKTGYILEHFQNSLKLPESFFEALRGRIPESKRYFHQGIRHEAHELDLNWRLFVPKTLLSVILKGWTSDDRV